MFNVLKVFGFFLCIRLVDIYFKKVTFFFSRKIVNDSWNVQIPQLFKQ